MGEGKHMRCEHPTWSVEAQLESSCLQCPGPFQQLVIQPPVFPGLGYTVLFRLGPKYITEEEYSQTVFPKPILQLKVWVYSSGSDPG